MDTKYTNTQGHSKFNTRSEVYTNKFTHQKAEKSKINNLLLHCIVSYKRKIPKHSRRKEIIDIIAEINEMENTIQNFNKIKSSS